MENILEEWQHIGDFLASDDQNKKCVRTVCICMGFHEVFYRNGGNGALVSHRESGTK